VDIRELQATIRATYGHRDQARGVEGTFAWFVEEVGELSRAIHRQGHDERMTEFSDVLAWLVSLADLTGVDLAEAAAALRRRLPQVRPQPLHLLTARPGSGRVRPAPRRDDSRE
jgi:NTP pyrophosphatase (non-canonical NTP hydrolase)